MAVNARIIKTAFILGGSEWKYWRPFFKPPNKMAIPKTKTEFPSIEPTNAAFTTVSKPARNAKIHTNNSGKFPKADC